MRLSKPMQPSEKLFRQSCEFIAGVSNKDALPEFDLPEIAFVGRSNVGKSSLINALTFRKSLARTSHTPGRTQQLNFFNLGGQLILVDLPGYGYAKVSRSTQATWQRLMRYYLKERANLKRVCVLVDGRHGLKPTDLEMMHMLDVHAVSYQVVVTKKDKVKATDLDAVLASIADVQATRAAMVLDVIVTSSHGVLGIDTLQKALYDLVHPVI